MAEKILFLENPERISDIFGSFDSHAALIEKELGVLLINRDSEIKIIGDEDNIEKCAEVLSYLERLSSLSDAVSEQNVLYAVTMVKGGEAEKLRSFDADILCISSKGRAIKPKTMGQKSY
ncbi:MAG TPA: phosphate starvation-inducible protein PhoH, partial [Clostridiales bacterium]|nr:phosphate starvation-inducible protein PhoH [Clostridiales bacterium]